MEGEKVPVKQFFLKEEDKTPPELQAGYESLTFMEREVLGQCALGRSTEEIAHHFKISPKTVDVHICNLSEKLGLRGKRKSAMMAHIARHFGLLTTRDLNFFGSPFYIRKG